MTIQEQFTHKVITCVLAMQISQNILIDLQGLKLFKNALKMQINRTIDLLTDVERKYYDDFFNSKENETSQVYEVYQNFIKEISQVPIYDAENLITMYNAYKKDPKSMEGITNKILR
jgi:hypothetical protein